MIDTDTVSVEELEERFDLELPCGGNLWPRQRPCPAEAAAVMVSTHACPRPTSFKCLACWQEWLQAAQLFGGGKCRCTKCGVVLAVESLYRPL